MESTILFLGWSHEAKEYHKPGKTVLREHEGQKVSRLGRSEGDRDVVGLGLRRKGGLGHDKEHKINPQ